MRERFLACRALCIDSVSFRESALISGDQRGMLELGVELRSGTAARSVVTSAASVRADFRQSAKCLGLDALRPAPNMRRKRKFIHGQDLKIGNGGCSQIGLAFRAHPTAQPQACAWDRAAPASQNTQYGEKNRTANVKGRHLLNDFIRVVRHAFNEDQGGATS